MYKKKVIYIHGFNSSPESYKAVKFGQYLAQRYHNEIEYLVPCLKHEPIASLIQLENLIDANTVLLGSSLGGFYATYLSQKYQIKAVLINPAVTPFNLMADYLGEQFNPYQNYRYHVTQSHIEQLKWCYLKTLLKPELLLLLQQTGDEVLNYQEAVKYYSQCHQQIEFGGDHSFIGFHNHFDGIVDFLNI